MKAKLIDLLKRLRRAERSPSVVVRVHNPWKRRIALTLVIFASFLAIVGTYFIGEWRGGYLHFRTATRLGRLHDEITKLKTKNEQLGKRLVFLKHTMKINAASRASLEHTLQKQQSEFVRMKNDLAFYQGIVAPAQGSVGVTIGGFQVLPTEDPHEYRYQIVLVRSRGHAPADVHGKCWITVSGTRAQKKVTLSLKSLSPNGIAEKKFQLHYFQNLAGTLVLPAAFMPRRVSVKVLVSGDSGGQVIQTFSWPESKG